MSSDTVEKLVLALAAAVVGAFLKALFDHWADSRKARRDREARHEQRLDAFRAKQTELQRKYLLELQEEYAKYVRFIFMLYNYQISELLSGKTWHDITLPENIDEGCRSTHLNVSIITSRIHNEDIRGMILTTKQLYSKIAMCEDPGEMVKHFNSLLELSNKISEDMGVIIRKIDYDEQKALMNFKP